VGNIALALTPALSQAWERGQETTLGDLLSHCLGSEVNEIELRVGDLAGFGEMGINVNVVCDRGSDNVSCDKFSL
jgi:hypothetical protein